MKQKCTLLLLSALCSLLSSACSTTPKAPSHFIAKYTETQPTTSQFTHCYGHGCRKLTETSFTYHEWQQISSHFTPKAKDPSDEKTQIAKAIGTMEQITGQKTGTDQDKYGTFPAQHKPYQLDCIDETINTTTYLTLLNDHQLLTHHTVKYPTSRGFLAGGWPHYSAVIEEKNSQKQFVVDSWFFDNGYPATILPVAMWKEGWKPTRVH